MQLLMLVDSTLHVGGGREEQTIVGIRLTVLLIPMFLLM